MDAKVSSELANLKKQIEAVSQAAIKQGSAQEAASKAAAAAVREQQKVRQQQLRADVAAAKQETANTIKAIEEKRAANQKANDRETAMRLAALEIQTKAVREAAKAQAKEEESAAKERAKLQQDQANYNTKMLNQNMKERQAYMQWWNRALQEQEEAQHRAAQRLEQMSDRFVTVMGRYLIQALRQQWSAALAYATEYGDALNLIRVITGKNAAEAEQLGQQYRQMAQAMSVTSTE